MKVSELLNKPSCWTQRQAARNAEDHPINLWSSEARSFCLLGAIERCYGVPGELTTDYEPVLEARRRVWAAIGHQSITAWNDNPARTFQDVRSVVERADI